MWQLSRFKAGDLVEVRSREEILATLDADGCLGKMPFMPEMLHYCGRRFTVAAVAHKTCDTANKTGGRKLNHAVHLTGARCDGSAHGGCEAECNLFWNDAWLKAAAGDAPEAAAGTRREHDSAPGGVSEERLRTATQDRGSGAAAPIKYVCQATQVAAATLLLPWWDLRQYVYDVTTRNHAPGHVFKVLLLAASRQLLRLPVAYGLLSRSIDRLHRLVTGKRRPHVLGMIAQGEPTPSASLDLRSGEWVRVKPASEIARTLDRCNKNRGMWFDADQVPLCEGAFEVKRRVRQIIDERTGYMIPLRNPCITLHGSVCSAMWSDDRLLCPRAITAYWREIWLERIDSPPEQ